jgi:hypothetical protein
MAWGVGQGAALDLYEREYRQVVEDRASGNEKPWAVGLFDAFVKDGREAEAKRMGEWAAERARHSSR